MAFILRLSLCNTRFPLIPIHHSKILFQFLKSRRQGKLMPGSRCGPAMDSKKKNAGVNVSLDPYGQNGFLMFQMIILPISPKIVFLAGNKYEAKAYPIS